MVAITKETAAFVAPRHSDGVASLLDLPREWLKRHALRQELAVMDSRILRDIGWNAYDARKEAAKPFWKA
ncbi:DUF1127 domain-containing protein [Thalassospira australica]|uniref:DUF1127 domain-containing protein n=1 Tax=Thalassospira australica TaxID=1528106 RepID=UPI00051A7DD7|nr:DUF1127 domain-containing protein [Thalassospira australica]